MKVKSLLFTLAIFTLSALHFSCKKDKSLLPMQVGKNTFFCVINGKIFTYEPFLSSQYCLSTKKVTYFPKQNGGSVWLKISGFLDGDIQGCHYLNIYIDSIISKGVNRYNLDSGNRTPYNNDDWNSVTYTKPQNCKFYNEKSDNVLGFVDINRFDTDEEIISGTFEFTITKSGNSDCEKIVAKVGRFDMIFNTVN